MNAVEFIYFSDNQQFMAVEEMVLYEYTHTNEDGVRQYRVVGISRWPEDTQAFLDGKPAKYLRVRQERDQP